jgi:hypothetical protein
MRRIIAAAVAICLFAAATPAPTQLVDGRDPERLRALFERWGYRPSLTAIRGEPVIWITVEGVRTAAGLGGCTNGRNCSYLLLLAFHDAIVDAPWEWLNTQNNFFDVVTLSRAANGILRVRTGFVIGRQGVPESTLRAVLADWASTNREILRRAAEARLARAR